MEKRRVTRFHLCMMMGIVKPFIIIIVRIMSVGGIFHVSVWCLVSYVAPIHTTGNIIINQINING
jgi:hypothetical protein